MTSDRIVWRCPGCGAWRYGAHVCTACAVLEERNRRWMNREPAPCVALEGSSLV